MAKIKCSICSSQCDSWDRRYMRRLLSPWFLELEMQLGACSAHLTGWLAIAVPARSAHSPQGGRNISSPVNILRKLFISHWIWHNLMIGLVLCRSSFRADNLHCIWRRFRWSECGRGCLPTKWKYFKKMALSNSTNCTYIWTVILYSDNLLCSKNNLWWFQL